MRLHSNISPAPAPASTVVRYISLLWLLSAPIHIQSFTRPSISPVLKGSVATKSASARITTELWQKKRQANGVAYTRRDKDAPTSDDEEVDTSTEAVEAVSKPPNAAVATKKSPTLAELEDLEEARLADLEAKEAAEQSAPRMTAPSNLYTDVYNTDSAGLPGASDNIPMLGISEEDPLNISPQKEKDLAQKRDALQNNRLNEMFAEEDADNAERQAQIKKIMEEDDRQWKEERKKRLLGKYANVESWEEVEEMVGEDRKKEVKGTFVVIHVICVYVYALSDDLRLYQSPVVIIPC